MSTPPMALSNVLSEELTSTPAPGELKLPYSSRASWAFAVSSNDSSESPESMSNWFALPVAFTAMERR
jgi:hypothetical protein